jgi:hypothetical protein
VSALSSSRARSAARERRLDRGVLASEQREHRVADAVPRVPRGGVRRVLAPREASRREIGADLLARAFDERSNDPAASRGDSRKAARAGSTHQPEEHRLGLIRPRVGRRDPRRACARRPLAQRLVARPAGLGLHVSPRHAHPYALERDAQPAAARGRGSGVLAGVGAKAVIDVEGADFRDRARVPQRGERGDERGRVRAAGQGDEDPIGRAEQAAAVRGLEDRGLQGLEVRGHGRA